MFAFIWSPYGMESSIRACVIPDNTYTSLTTFRTSSIHSSHSPVTVFLGMYLDDALHSMLNFYNTTQMSVSSYLDERTANVIRTFLRHEDPARGIYQLTSVRDFLTWEPLTGVPLCRAVYKDRPPRFIFVGVFVAAIWFETSVETRRVDVYLRAARLGDLSLLSNAAKVANDQGLAESLQRKLPSAVLVFRHLISKYNRRGRLSMPSEILLFCQYGSNTPPISRLLPCRPSTQHNTIRQAIGRVGITRRRPRCSGILHRAHGFWQFLGQLSCFFRHCSTDPASRISTR